MSGSETATAPLAHHFDSVEQQQHALTLGMWVFLVTEIMLFGGLIAGGLIYRSLYADSFAKAAAHLDVTLGTVNTLVLIASSLAVVLAVHAAQQGSRARVSLSLAVTIALGLLFLGIKAVEYGDKLEHHLVPGASFRFEGAGEAAGHAELFFSLYFLMTGLHALHMVIGVGLFSFVLGRAARGAYTGGDPTGLELAGLYWHLVDVIWIFLFPLLYLIGGAEP